MVNIEDVLLNALGMKGHPYVFGAEASPGDADPKAFDCSELVQWACDRSHVTPAVPDGAFNQWKHCTPISVADAVHTRGALLFVGDGTGSGRNAIVHVAWSLGDGTTIEARGKAWGVGSWTALNRFDFAGLIPGVDYTPGRAQETDDMYDQHARDEVVTKLDQILSLLKANLGPAINEIRANEQAELKILAGK